MKQETLEEASWRYNPVKKLDAEFIRQAFKEGAKWQGERMYSEEDLEVAFFEGRENNLPFTEWFEQFKKVL
jgi:DNA polymerase elongation subunit (family B)